MSGPLPIRRGCGLVAGKPTKSSGRISRRSRARATAHRISTGDWRSGKKRQARWSAAHSPCSGTRLPLLPSDVRAGNHRRTCSLAHEPRIRTVSLNRRARSGVFGSQNLSAHEQPVGNWRVRSWIMRGIGNLTLLFFMANWSVEDRARNMLVGSDRSWRTGRRPIPNTGEEEQPW